MKFLCSLFLISLFPGLGLSGYTQEKSKKCNGSFRWDVKTLTDNNGVDLVSLSPFDSTLNQLLKVKPPEKLFILSKKNGRFPRFSTEKYLVRIIAYIDKIKIQSDQDFHVSLRSPDMNGNMIGEIPDPDCQGLDNYPELRNKFREARNQGIEVWELLKTLKKPVLAEVTGIPFWDAPHFWLKGSSKTGREIHPIINIRILGK